jgi:predicted ATP-binding protein involved in virulence
MAARTIKDIHEEVFQFLLEKHQMNNELRFTLRSSNRFGLLEEGYWFEGTDEWLSITFWNSYDDFDRPSIDFLMYLDGICTLRVNENHNHNKKAFIIDNLIPALGMIKNANSKKNRNGIHYIDSWQKSYSKSNEVIETLSQFLSTDKVIIDGLIRGLNQSDIFPSIDDKTFKKSLAIINKWREPEKSVDFDTLAKHSIKLQSIQLKAITHFENLSLNLNKQVTCLIGFNGSGKSTILRAIAMSLIGVQSLKELDSEKIFDLERLLMIWGAQEDGIRYVKSGSIKLLYTIDDFGINDIISNEIMFRESERSRQEIDIEDNPNQDIDTLLLNEPDDNYFLKYLVIGFSQQAKNTNRDKKDNQVNKKRKNRPNIEDLTALIYDEPDNRFSEFQKWIIDLISVEKYPVFKQREDNRALINGIFKVISNITNDNIQLTNSLNDAFIITKYNPDGIPLSQMSQGYRNVIGWLGYFMKRLWEYGQVVLPTIDFKQLPAICLIDEIDTYLHPDWQYTILSSLVEAFPNTQFIVTSHSPYVLTSIKSEKLAIYELYSKPVKTDRMKFTEDGNWYIENVDSLSVDIKQVNENLYLADVNRSTVAMNGSERFRNAKKDVSQDIDTLFDLIESNQLAEAQAFYQDRLSEIDTELDEDMLKIKRLMRTKEALNKAKSSLVPHEIN